MAFSSGTFTLVAGNPVVTATTISSTWANNTLSDIATGLTTCLLKDGTQTATAVIPFAAGMSATTGVFTDTLTPSQTKGIVGTTTNNVAQAGSVGEVISGSRASASALSLSNNVTATIASISLSAGDWDVTGLIGFIPAATTTFGQMSYGTSPTAATLDTDNFGQQAYNAATTFGGNTLSFTVPTRKFLISTTTTVYLSAQAGFGTSTVTAWGNLRAIRTR